MHIHTHSISPENAHLGMKVCKQDAASFQNALRLHKTDLWEIKD